MVLSYRLIYALHPFFPSLQCLPPVPDPTHILLGAWVEPLLTWVAWVEAVSRTLALCGRSGGPTRKEGGRPPMMGGLGGLACEGFPR